MENRSYIAIDLKSFYASVECMQRGLNPMQTNLVVADKSRTSKTICLAVTPSLKSFGIPGRARLFEVEQKVREVNALRRTKIGGREFLGSSCDAIELTENPNLELSFIAAPPRMALYMEYSTRIYDIYLKYVAPEDIHVYSVDEVFIDVTTYLNTYQMTARQLTSLMIKDVFEATGITATAGIGTNLYLCKIAMDIVAKHIDEDENGARIAELDEMSYRYQLWNHRPITDFWRVGRGIAKRLSSYGMYTMGDVARCSVGNEEDFYNEDLLYKLFGVNAELLIDHAWGWEPCDIAEIKAYRPETNSVSSGQVLKEPYTVAKTRVVVQEMIDALGLDLLDKRLVTDQIVLTIGYDVENILDSNRRKRYKGEITIDRYGREVPKHAHGTVNLREPTALSQLLMESTLELFDRIVDEDLLVRRITIAANRIKLMDQIKKEDSYEQLDLFTDYGEEQERKNKLEREQKMQQAVLDIKKRYGKNAVLRGTNFREGATARERNAQIGGHKA